MGSLLINDFDELLKSAWTVIHNNYERRAVSIEPLSLCDALEIDFTQQKCADTVGTVPVP